MSCASSFSDLLFPSFSWHPRESSPVICASSFPRPDGGKAAKNLTATPQFPVLSSFSRLSFFFRHSRALPGNPVPNCEDQDWIPAFGENDGGEGKARMTAGRGRAASLQSDLLFPTFFFRHSRGIHGNPVLSYVRLPSPVTMAARPQKNLTATPQFPVLSSFSRLSFFFRHRRALPGNPVPNCEDQDWIPAFGENDGGEGEGKGKGRVIPGVVRVFFLRPSFSVILVASTGIQSCPMCVFPRPDGGKAAKNPNGYAAISRPFVIVAPCPGIQFLIAKTRTGFPPSARMTAGKGKGRGRTKRCGFPA